MVLHNAQDTMFGLSSSFFAMCMANAHCPSSNQMGKLFCTIQSKGHVLFSVNLLVNIAKLMTSGNTDKMPNIAIVSCLQIWNHGHLIGNNIMPQQVILGGMVASRIILLAFTYVQ